MSWKRACKVASKWRARGWRASATWRSGKPVVFVYGKIERAR